MGAAVMPVRLNLDLKVEQLMCGNAFVTCLGIKPSPHTSCILCLIECV